MKVKLVSKVLPNCKYNSNLNFDFKYSCDTIGYFTQITMDILQEHTDYVYCYCLNTTDWNLIFKNCNYITINKLSCIMPKDDFALLKLQKL